MASVKPTNDQSEIKQKQGGGDAELKDNACCKCKEGCVIGENVYCSLDGRFHPLRDNLACKSFIPKD